MMLFEFAIIGDNPASDLLRNTPVSDQRHSPIEGVTVIDHPLIRVKLTIIRDRTTSSEEFRRELKELATLMTFEVSRDFQTSARVVQTPLAAYSGVSLARPVIIAPILRAGLGFVDGMLQVLSNASVGHIGMYRDEKTHRPESDYIKLPSHLSSAEVLVVDPMLATGWSATGAISQLKENGARHLRFVCLVSCPTGLQQLRGAHPDVPIFTAAIDPELNEKAYIVPGLGDAGDRYFGDLLLSGGGVSSAGRGGLFFYPQIHADFRRFLGGVGDNAFRKSALNLGEFAVEQ